ncbi:Serine/arginine-rich splicing factor 4-like 1 [Homarus americanus]|uniref:Serine/arginine-rich splicing factor 4-like 1 n=1 Tax=Homarus americanus TaxID=6706 RepID=A0A8J5K1T8_HOMAM|nr:Serine/arginine-rich splicing factor 4-like 1 [Homarus americanus]
MSEPDTVLLYRVLVEFARGTRSAVDSLYSGSYSRKARAPWMEKVMVEKARASPRVRWPRGGGGGGAGQHQNRPQQLRYGLPTRTDYRLIVENLSSRVS